MPKSPVITPIQSRAITQMIRNWPSSQKLTWDLICSAAKLHLDYVPTRQALSRKSDIATAYGTRKLELRDRRNSHATVARPKSILDAMDRIAKLQENNQRLEKELQLMAETARRYIHNASLRGLKPSDLMRALPQKRKKSTPSES